MMARAGLSKTFIDQLKQDQKVYYGIIKEGEPNGFVSEEGINKITAPLIIETDFSHAAQVAMEYNNRYGITAWLDPSVSSINPFIPKPYNFIEWYHYLINKGKLTAHIAAVIVVDANADPITTISTVKVLQKNITPKIFQLLV